jgi:hypothetical protein
MNSAFAFQWRARAFKLCVLVPALLVMVLARPLSAGVMDLPFPQPVSHHYPLPEELAGTARKLVIDQDGVVFILTLSGVARLMGDRIALDQSHRPLAGKVARDITVAEGRLYYLFSDEVLSQRRAGKFVHPLARSFDAFSVNSKEEVLLREGKRFFRFIERAFSEIEAPHEISDSAPLFAIGPDFFLVNGQGVWKLHQGRWNEFASGHEFTCVTRA